jgi:hypothetical protein
MAMQRRLVAFAGIAVAALLAVAVGAFVLLQDPERYRADITAMLGAAAGQPVELAGPLHLTWRPSPMLSVGDVRIALDGARVSMRSLQVAVEPHALLLRKLRARQVIVHGLRVDLDASDADAARLPDLAALGVGTLELRDVAVSRAGAPWFAFDAATLREADSAAGARVDLSGRIDGRDLRARARLRTAPGQVELDALQVHLPLGVVNGHLRAVLGPRLELSGELRADALSADTRTWRAMAVDLDALADVDVSLRIRVGRLSVARFMVSEIVAPVNLRAGNLEVRAAGVLADGPLRATLHASAAQRDFTLDLALTGADAGNVLVMGGLTTAERGGRLSLEAELRASGADAAARLASLQGQVAVDAAGLTIRAGTAKLADSDVLASLLRALQPGVSGRVTLGCALGRFVVRDGVVIADNAIGMQSRTMNLLGGGRIALAERRVDLVLRPWRRAGQSPRAAGMAGAVVITGALTQPQVGVAGEARVGSGADVDAMLSGDGLLRIARGLLERAQGDAPCAQAAGSVASSPGSMTSRGRRDIGARLALHGSGAGLPERPLAARGTRRAGR